MPLYDYECQQCGEVHEIRHGFNDTVNHPCPACGSGTLVRKFHAAPIVFKGSGFYVTDSRGSNPGSKSEAGSGTGESKTETKSEPKSDSKPEAAA